MLNIRDRISAILLALTMAGFASPAGAGGQYDNTLAKDFILDAPWRVIDAGTAIPITVILKDCDDDDIRQLHWIRCRDITGGGATTLWHHDFGDERIGNDPSEHNYWTYITTVTEGHPSLPNGTLLTPANLGYAAGDAIQLHVEVYYRDDIFNYTDSRTLRVHVGNGPFPWPADWYGGDTHYHTMYTNDIAEFGAPLPAVALTAEAMGLQWLTTTDHSCDIDETGDGAWSYATDQWEFTVQSPAGISTTYRNTANYGGTWGSLGADAADFSTSRFRIYRGTEINLSSIDPSSFDKTLHCLFYSDTYISSPYCGTITERPVTPDVPGGLGQLSGGGFAYASHPVSDLALEFGGLDFAVNGAVWGTADLSTAVTYEPFRGLEVFNSRATRYSLDQNDPWAEFDAGTLPSDPYPTELLAGISLWDQMLRDGIGDPIGKVFLSGGSDGHGDFNYSSFLSIDNYATDNAMGKVQTVVHMPGSWSAANLPPTDSLMAAFRRGRSVVTDGPFLEIGIDADDDGSWYGPGDLAIGDDGVFTPASPLTLRMRWATLPEFGQVTQISLLDGDGAATATVASFDPSGTGMASAGDTLFDIGALGLTGTHYFRAELVTSDGGSGHRAYTNPIWIDFDPATDVAGNKPPATTLVTSARPNPFNPSVAIRFELPVRAAITATIFDVNGKRVQVLADNRTTEAGDHVVHWDGTDGDGHAAPSGAYFYVIEAGGERSTGKVTLVR